VDSNGSKAQEAPPNIKKKSITVVRKTKYQDWISESDKGDDFCLCTWCDATFLRKNITGPKGHLQSESHKKEVTKH